MQKQQQHSSSTELIITLDHFLCVGCLVGTFWIKIYTDRPTNIDLFCVIYTCKRAAGVVNYIHICHRFSIQFMFSYVVAAVVVDDDDDDDDPIVN